METLVALALLHFNRRDYGVSRELAERVVAMAQAAEAPAVIAGANVVLGFVTFSIGQFLAAREHFERAVELLGAGPSRNYGAFYAQFVPKILVGVLVILGYPSSALISTGELLARARQKSDPHSIANALDTDAMCHVMLRDTRTVAERADEVISIATEHEMPLNSISATFYLGWAMAAAGRADEGIAEMRRSLSAPMVVEGSWPALMLTVLAETCGESGRVEEALDLVANGLATVKQTGLRVAEAELYRLKGELLIIKDPGNLPEVEHCLRTAIDVARRQGARLFELRATVSLARLLRDTDRSDEARTILVEIYAWFTEGFDTPDLKDAKALLHELSR
jgi:predicted ATPase